MRILEVTFDSKLMFEIHLRKVVSKAARNLGVMRQAIKLFDCSRVLMGCFNAYALPSLKYCAPVWIPSAQSHLGLLDRIVRSTERFCEGKLCCLGHRRKFSA